MDGAIGYTPERINEFAKEIADRYKKLGEVMANDWPWVSSTLQENWKGADEQSYEDNLAARMRTLYKNCREVVTGLATQIINVGESWQEMQNKNVIQNGEGTTATKANFDFQVPQVEEFPIDNTVKLAENAFTGQALGLQGPGSESAITSRLDNYFDNIKTEIQTMMDQVSQFQDAFIGQAQSQAISDYLKQGGQLIASVATDADDLRQALASVTTKAYESQESTVATGMNQAASGMQGTTGSN